jgi:hypothetical protein
MLPPAATILTVVETAIAPAMGLKAVARNT